MRNKIIKIIGYCCLFCIVVISWIFISNILWPALAQPRATKPLLVFRPPVEYDPARLANVFQYAVSSLTFTPDGKQLLGRYYADDQDQIKRWNVSDGKELTPIQNPRIRFLSDDGRFYVTYDLANHEALHQVLHRISDQSAAAILPDDTKDRQLIKIIGGDHPVAVYFYSKRTPAKGEQKYADLFNLTRSYFFWDVEAKHFSTEAPHVTELYDYRQSNPMDVAFADDGSKVLSLWPTYTRTDDDKTVTVTKNFIPWFMPDYKQKPKEASLLNEINGNITTLPLPEKSLNFDFNWVNATLSANQKYFAAAGTSTTSGWILDGNDGTIWCYDLPNRQLKWKYPPGKDLPDMLRFSPDGTMLAAGGSNDDYRINGVGFLKVIDVKSGELIHSFTEQILWQQIRDRTRIAFLQLLDNNAHAKKRFPDILHAINFPPAPGNSGRIYSIAWSPDSKTLAAAYEDGSVKLWRVK
jgi:WD40 repeat protein